MPQYPRDETQGPFENYRIIHRSPRTDSRSVARPLAIQNRLLSSALHLVVGRTKTGGRASCCRKTWSELDAAMWCGPPLEYDLDSRENSAISGWVLSLLALTSASTLNEGGHKSECHAGKHKLRWMYEPKPPHPRRIRVRLRR